jgi:hypothetical protein
MQLNVNETDYYSLGSIDDLFISNSLLNSIDPALGGHPKKAKEFLQGEKPPLKSKFVITGNVIHSWLEDRANFAVAEIDKPAEKAGEIADKMIEIAEFFPEKDEYELFVEARKEIEYYKSRTDESVYKTWKETGSPYFQFYQVNQNKVILSKEDKQILENIQNNINTNSAVQFFLLGSGMGIETKNEQVLTWTLEYTSGYKLKHKVKIDRTIIDHNSKTIYIVDFKTTSKNGYSYAVSNFPLRITEFISRKIYRQFAFYEYAITATRPKELEDYKIVNILIVIETTGLNNLFCFEIDRPHIHEGQLEVTKLTNEVLYAHKNNKWDLFSFEYLNPIIKI